MQANKSRYSLAARPARTAAATGDVVGFFAQGNPAANPPVPYTPVMSDFLNDLIQELANLLAFGGFTFSDTDQGQVLKAVQHLLYQPTILGGFMSVTPQDTLGNGGFISLQGSHGAATYSDIAIDNYVNNLRIFQNTADPFPAFNLDIFGGVLRIGDLNTGNISCAGFSCGTDVNGNHVYYFVDAKGNQTGHLLQDSAGKLHFNTGTSHEATLDTSGNFNTPGQIAGGAGAAFAGGTVTAAAFSTPDGTGFSNGNGFFSNTSIEANTTITAKGNLQGAGLQLDGSVITMNPTGQYSALNGAFPLLQIVYNNGNGYPLFEAGVYQSELWCNGALLAINSNGAVYAQTQGKAAKVIVADPSSVSMKENIKPIEDALATVMAVPAYSYNYREGVGPDPEVTHFGHMYEDLVKHIPQATLIVDDTPQIMLHKTTPYLWRAVQQLSEANQSLRAENAKLHDRMDAIAARLDALEGGQK